MNDKVLTEISIDRFEQDLFSIDMYSLSDSIPYLKKKYPEFRKQREKNKGYSSPELDKEQYEWCVERLQIPAYKIKDTIEKLMYKLPLHLIKKARYPGVQDFFECLRKNKIRIAIYSDYPVDEKLVALDLMADKTFCSTQMDIGQFKPTNKTLLKICDIFRCDIKNTVYIGDREDTDGESARMAGMEFLKVQVKQARKGVFYSNLINQFIDEEEN
ncbi:hypothetical protein ES708_07153 [subsurface metagenome]